MTGPWVQAHFPPGIRPPPRYLDALAVGALPMLIGGVFVVALSAAIERPAPVLLEPPATTAPP